MKTPSGKTVSRTAGRSGAKAEAERKRHGIKTTFQRPVDREDAGRTPDSAYSARAKDILQYNDLPACSQGVRGPHF